MQVAFQETGQGGADLTLFSGAPLSNSLNSGLRQVRWLTNSSAHSWLLLHLH